MANFFWVGDSGDIADDSHWSTSSGGAGGAGVPSIGDTAIFDANSFTVPSVITMDTIVAPFIWEVDTIDASTATQPFSVELTDGSQHTDIITDVSFIGSANLTVADQDPSIINSNLVQMTGIVDPQGATFSVKNVSILEGMLQSDYQQDGFGRTIISGNFDAGTSSLGAGAFRLQNNSGQTIDMGTGTWHARPTVQIDGDLPIDRFFEVIIDMSNGSIDCNDSLLLLDLSLYTYGPPAKLIASGIVLNDCTLLGNNVSAKTLYITNSDFPGVGPLFNNFATSDGPLIIGIDADGASDPDTINGLTVSYTQVDGYNGDGELQMVGTPGHEITIFSLTPGSPMQIRARQHAFAFIDVTDSTAEGNIPFDATDNGINEGGNTNWLFGTNPTQEQQTVFLVFSDSDGDVQLFDAGHSDNGAPISYELETQQLDFSNRMHLKKIADKLVVFMRAGGGGEFGARDSAGDYHPIDILLNDRVNIGDDINLEGNFFTFRWAGSSGVVSPVFEGFYIPDITDLGMTYG